MNRRIFDRARLSAPAMLGLGLAAVPALQCDGRRGRLSRGDDPIAAQRFQSAEKPETRRKATARDLEVHELDEAAVLD